MFDIAQDDPIMDNGEDPSPDCHHIIHQDQLVKS